MKKKDVYKAGDKILMLNTITRKVKIGEILGWDTDLMTIRIEDKIIPFIFTPDYGWLPEILGLGNCYKPLKPYK